MQHQAGAVAALLAMTTACWTAALLMEVTIAVNTWPGSATLLMRGLVLPLVAGQVVWLSALATMAGRRPPLSLPKAIPVGAAYALAIYLVAPAVPAALTTVAAMMLVPFTFAVTIGASAWIVRSRSHA